MVQPGLSSVDVLVSQVIGRPLEVVATYANDPSHAPDWYANISAVEWRTTPPARVGTEVAFVARFLGRELRYTYRVVELTAESLVMRTAQGPFPMETSYRYESTADGGTRMTLRNTGTPSGFSRLVAPFIRVAMRRATSKDLRVLQRILERAQSRADALLDAAEAEFASAGIERGSLRSIMRHAGMDPGAVHYHFGGREALAAAVLDRILVPINARRLELLAEAAATGPPTVARLVEALIRPDLEAAQLLNAQSSGRARLIGAVYTHPSDFVAVTVAGHFAPVADAFRPHLETAIPRTPFDVIAWRIRWCVFGPVGALLTDESAPFQRSVHDVVTDLVGPLAAALAA